jgi:SPP1 family predicted phage head-tail adaptor
MGSLAAGTMDRRITLQQATVTYDALNNPTETWATLATVWASKEDLSDSERVAAAEVGAAMTTRFRIRYSDKVSGINPKNRLTFDDRTWDIQNVKEIGRKEGLEISAIARTDD